jgi:glutaredoxin
MAIIRRILGALILTLNWLFTPRGVKRDDVTQAAVDSQTNGLTLYQYKACPFCVKVRRAMRRQSLAIETRDVKRSEAAREQLLKGAGDLKVPCLKIEGDGGEVTWMVESGKIIGYLEERFTLNPVACPVIN